MLRVTAAPRIQFMHGSQLRPWIIPVSLDFNVISPPSDAVTVLNTGMVFGAGADYEVFKGISIGVDGRYHWTPDNVDGVESGPMGLEVFGASQEGLLLLEDVSGQDLVAGSGLVVPTDGVHRRLFAHLGAG